MNKGTHQYGSQTYWENRYIREPCTFEWYHGYAGLKPLIRQHISFDSNILQIGVGTSTLQECMAKDGYRQILNVDYSQVVIDHMKQLHKDVDSLVYKQVDCRDMHCFPANAFDAIIDKGTLDAILCGENSVADATRALSECLRVLQPGGAYMLITYGDPQCRLCYLDNPVLTWDVQMYYISKRNSIDNPTYEGTGMANGYIQGPYTPNDGDAVENMSALQDVHFVYICRKRIGRFINVIEESSTISESDEWDPAATIPPH